MGRILIRDFQKRVSSPLRYPGGKSRAVQAILARIPLDEHVLCSPFLGGASIELACAARGMRVVGFDAFAPLVAFWQTAIKDPKALADAVQRYYPLSKKRFYALQKKYPYLTDQTEKAAIFYVLNRASFSGTTMSGGMSAKHPRFTPTAIQRLRHFKTQNITVQQQDFRQSIPQYPDAFLYVDPPYLNHQKLYGHKGDTHRGFNHHDLAELLKKRDRWVLSYNDCPAVRTLYKGFGMLSLEWKYGMNTNKRSNELLILSQDQSDRALVRCL